MGGRGDFPPWAPFGGPLEGKIKRKNQATRGKMGEKGQIKEKNKKNYKKIKNGYEI